MSHKTVSRVLNGEPHVRPALKERVLEAVQALNYHPNLIAKALVQRRSYLIGLVYENPSPSYVVELQMGVLERLVDERYRLIVIPVRSVRDNADEIVSLLRSASLDGVVLAPPAADHPGILRELRSAGIVYARIGATRELEMGANNLLDDIAAAREAADHLIALGHREIGIIKGDPTHHSSDARLIGYSQAMAAAGIDMCMSWIEQGYYTVESGFEAARRLLSAARRPTAILAQNDDMAIGALMVAREMGLAVPGDISIVGFDDSEVSRIVWPRLTTVRQPVYEMAVAAADMVIAQLAGRALAPDKRHMHTLVVRESTASPAVGAAVPSVSSVQ